MNRLKRNYFYKGHDHSEAAWHFSFQYQTDLPVESIWPVLGRIQDWPKVDNRVAYVRINEAPAAGVVFRLKPFKTPELKMQIVKFEPPFLYSDLCRLPGAQVYFSHQLSKTGKETLIRASIEIDGPLTKFWVAVFGDKFAAGLHEQTERLLIVARGGIE